MELYLLCSTRTNLFSPEIRKTLFTRRSQPRHELQWWNRAKGRRRECKRKRFWSWWLKWLVLNDNGDCVIIKTQAGIQRPDLGRQSLLSWGQCGLWDKVRSSLSPLLSLLLGRHVLLSREGVWHKGNFVKQQQSSFCPGPQMRNKIKSLRVPHYKTRLKQV